MATGHDVSMKVRVRRIRALRQAAATTRSIIYGAHCEDNLDGDKRVVSPVGHGLEIARQLHYIAPQLAYAVHPASSLVLRIQSPSRRAQGGERRLSGVCFIVTSREEDAHGSNGPKSPAFMGRASPFPRDLCIIRDSSSPTSATRPRFCQISVRSYTQIFVFVATSFYLSL